MNATTVRIGLACSALVLALGGALAAQTGTKPGPKDEDIAKQRKIIAQAMASKLKHTQNLIAALSLEDFDLIADSARSLKQIGQETLWKVSPNLTYVKYGAEFVSIAEELARRAKENDLNGATLSYVRLTINCVECHKFARDNRIYDLRH